MLQRIHIQILDNPFEDVNFSESYYDEGVNNQTLAEQLQTSFDYQYPNLVLVEYIDLFLEDESRFAEVRELISHGLITLPVILINGEPFIHGAISYRVIHEEVERLISKGPVH
ncbi:MAG: hypothetical protein D6710_08445 [Nitrospirae bacterium]|nr:MAG: hypothetical protein D6710_08445 [Nitrospirota bacterium]